MANDYLDEKEAKRKIGLNALIFLMILAAFVLTLLVKIIFTGSSKPEMYTDVPTSGGVYNIAKEYVRLNLKSPDADFNDSGYQFGKTSDSVYVIKSSAEITNKDDEKVIVNFKIVLKYNGGKPSLQKNWSLRNLDTN